MKRLYPKTQKISIEIRHWIKCFCVDLCIVVAEYVAAAQRLDPAYAQHPINIDDGRITYGEHTLHVERHIDDLLPTHYFALAVGERTISESGVSEWTCRFSGPQTQQVPQTYMGVIDQLNMTAYFLSAASGYCYSSEMCEEGTFRQFQKAKQSFDSEQIQTRICDSVTISCNPSSNSLIFQSSRNPARSCTLTDLCGLNDMHPFIYLRKDLIGSYGIIIAWNFDK